MTEQYPKLVSGKELKNSPSSDTIAAILAFSRSVEVKKKGTKKILIHLN